MFGAINGAPNKILVQVRAIPKFSDLDAKVLQKAEFV